MDGQPQNITPPQEGRRYNKGNERGNRTLLGYRLVVCQHITSLADAESAQFGMRVDDAVGLAVVRTDAAHLAAQSPRRRRRVDDHGRLERGAAWRRLDHDLLVPDGRRVRAGEVGQSPAVVETVLSVDNLYASHTSSEALVKVQGHTRKKQELKGHK